LQEIQRKAVDQRHRSDGQHGKDPGQAQGQSARRAPTAVQAEQTDQIVQNQDGQRASPTALTSSSQAYTCSNWVELVVAPTHQH
jgi:hypothetical protein